MKVINLYGGPGTGKSTTAALLFALLKLQGRNVELVREYAKEKVWAELPLDCQFEIAVEQYRRQRILKDKVEYIITDSPLLLGKYYSHYDPDICMLIDALNSRFQNINIFLNRVKEYNPAGRLQTETEAKEIDLKLKALTPKFDLHVDADAQAAEKILETI